MIEQHIEALRRRVQGTATPLVEAGSDGRRRTCRYVSGPFDQRCTGIPAGSLDAEIELCTKHLRLALELVTAEDITL